MNEDPIALYIVAAITGLSGLFGVLIGSAIHFAGLLFDRKWKKEQKIAERFEDYAHCLNEALQWFQRVGVSKSNEDINAEPHSSDARKMVVIATLYFPELKKKTTEFSNLSVSYMHLLIECYDSLSPKNAATQAIEKGNGRFEEIGEEIIKIKP